MQHVRLQVLLGDARCILLQVAIYFSVQGQEAGEDL